MASKPTIAIIGNGWAGFTLAHALLPSKYNIKVIAPLRTIQYTPLLASAAAGHFDFRLAEEPVRRRNKLPELQYFKARVENINFEKKTLKCVPALEELAGNDFKSDGEFVVEYDKLIICPGCINQTFGTPGAIEHSNFLRTTDDARLIQQRILEMLDAASVPGLTDDQLRDILKILIVGGGPIGIEAAAELFDLWNEDMRFLYPHLDGKFSIEIHDVADKILGSFDERLGEYALQKLSKRGIKIQTGSHIEKVEKGKMWTKELGEVKCGMVIWATGNGANPLIENLEGVRKTEKGVPRVLTDRRLRVQREEEMGVMEDVYALGDSADVEGYELPMLAEVAVQKAEWLARALNEDGGPVAPFEYKKKANLAYLGGQDGVIGGQEEWTGQSAWLAWRSGSIWHWPRSWRRTLMIGISWVFNVIGGRDIARKW